MHMRRAHDHAGLPGRLPGSDPVSTGLQPAGRACDRPSGPGATVGHVVDLHLQRRLCDIDGLGPHLTGEIEVSLVYAGLISQDNHVPAAPTPADGAAEAHPDRVRALLTAASPAGQPPHQPAPANPARAAAPAPAAWPNPRTDQPVRLRADSRDDRAGRVAGDPGLGGGLGQRHDGPG